MILPTEDFEQLLHLADELESGDYFEENARQFKQLAEMLKKRIYRYCKDADILDLADQLPQLDFEPHQRSFLEQLLPKTGRSMVGNYKIKTSIRAQARETKARFKEIRRWLGEETV